MEYLAYGLHVLSDGPIPGLLPSAGAERVDLRIWLNQRPPWFTDPCVAEGAAWFRSSALDERGLPILTIWQLPENDWYRFVYYDGNEFLVNPRIGEIWSAWPPNITPEDSATYLVGPVLGFVLRLRGMCCLHASAISIGQEVIAFAGPQHTGKSTTAAAFAKLGHPVVTDDIVCLEEEGDAFLVRPGYPRLCLWPSATVPLYGSPRELPRIIPEWEKCYLDLSSDGYHFQIQSLPLSAIYLLEERADAADCFRVEAVSTHAALVSLAANTYMNYLLDRGLRSGEFEFLTRVVAKVPVRRVLLYKDPASLPKLCTAILEDYQGLGSVPDSAIR